MKPSKSFCRQHRCCLSSIKRIREILDESHSFFFNVFFMTLQRWLHIFQTWTEEDPWKILFLWFCWNKAKPFQPWATKTEMPSFAEKKDCFRDRNCWSKKTSIILGKLCYYRWKSCNNRDPLQHQHAANSTPTSPAWIAHRSLIAICRIRDSRIVAQPLLPLVP